VGFLVTDVPLGTGEIMEKSTKSLENHGKSWKIW
jgi:hypothetical protein